MTPRPPAVPRLLCTALLGVALLAGCTAGGADQDAAAPAAGAPEAGGAPSSGGAGPSTGNAVALGRSALAGSAVIHTAELGVRVDDVRTAADEAGRLVREAGGSVAAERTDVARRAGSDLPGGAGAELRLRVPPEGLDELVGRLAALGQERSRSLGTEEVGDELVDLQVRLGTQRASVERVRALLAEATDLSEVVQIEAELTRRTADLESLQARLAALSGQVEMSTVLLWLDSASEPVAADGRAGFLDGLRSGWAALVATLLVLATVTGALLPFLPLAAGTGWLLLRSRSRGRMRSRRAAPAAGPVSA